MAAVKALQQWCRLRCEGYRDVSITNMTTSFRDGLAFCALIHKHRPDLINFDSLKKENVYENNKLAFRVAEEELGIPALLDAEDMVALKVPDRLSILTYVSQYYNYFHGRSPIGGMGGIKRPADVPTEEPPGKKNQAVTSKVFPSSKPARENSPPPSFKTTRPSPSPKQTRRVTQEEKPHQTGTLSNKCVVCNKHVHLVQRHLVDGKLYHRSCAKLLSQTNTTAPFRDLSTNTPVSKFTPAPDSTKPITNTPTYTPSRLGPTWLAEKPSTPPSSYRAPSPSRPASSLSPAAKESPTSSASKPAASRTTFESTITTTAQPTPAPRTSTTAAKTLQSKLKFFQSDKTTSDDEKKTTTTNTDLNKKTTTTNIDLNKKTTTPNADLNKKTTTTNIDLNKKTTTTNIDLNKKTTTTNIDLNKKTTTANIDINKGSNVTGRVQQAAAGQPVTVVVNVGGVGGKEANVSLNTGVGKAKAAGGVGGDSGKVGETSKTKASAAAFISKKLAEENNNDSSKPSWTTAVLKKTDKPAQVETPKKEPESVRGRVKLRADPSLLADLQTPDPPSPAPSPASRTGLRARSPDRGASKPSSASPSTSASDNVSPADWKSMLKPVSKPASPSQSSLKPWTNGKPQPSEASVRPTPASLLPSPSSSVATPATTGFQNGQGDQTANGTKSESKIPKTKPDYIMKEDIIKELQEIEDNLNELEKRGVDLEMKLRSSEEEGEDDSVMDGLMVEWFNLIRNKQVAMRRESELVYIGRTQDLEEQQPSVEQELRRLMEKPERLKTSWDRKREEQLIAKLLEIVNDRNAIIEGLDEDRLREEEEDEELNKMMKNFNIKKDKPKKKSPMSKLFGWGNKKEG